MLEYHRRQHDAYRYGSNGTLSASQELYTNGGGGGGGCCNRYLPPPPPSCCSCDHRSMHWNGGNQVRMCYTLYVFCFLNPNILTNFSIFFFVYKVLKYNERIINVSLGHKTIFVCIFLYLFIFFLLINLINNNFFFIFSVKIPMNDFAAYRVKKSR